MTRNKNIFPVVRVVRQEEPRKDLAYWRSRSYSERLAALEEIRQEYHQWKGDAQPGLQRVYQIIKR